LAGYADPVRAIRCDECERPIADGSELVLVFYDEDDRLRAVLTREDLVDLRGCVWLACALRFHRDCYPTARVKEPPLPLPDAAE
jgi:hypothetical protein